MNIVQTNFFAKQGLQLDPMKGAYPALGDEQVFDIELDRSTPLLPVAEDYCLPTLDGDLRNNRSSIADIHKDANDSVPGMSFYLFVHTFRPSFSIIQNLSRRLKLYCHVFP